MLRHLAWIANNGEEEKRAFFNDILKVAFSSPTSQNFGMNKHCVNFHDASQGLILVLTKNNDHQTLSEILQMGEAAGHRLENLEESENPMVEASLADDIKCMRVLHKAGYRVRLANED